MVRATTAEYAYRPLAGPSSIRLLDLASGYGEQDVEVSLREERLPDNADEAPWYTALSYTWGSPLEKRSPIQIDSFEILVRPNLLLALKALRDPKEVKTLWIDALCINQEDVTERNDQVSLMARIYRMAQNAVVWLGIADENSEIAMEYMKYNTRYHNLVEQTQGNLLNAIRATLQRDYWFRAWIVQEVCLARKITLQCGSTQLSWDDFATSCISLQKQLSSTSPASQLVQQRAMAVKDDSHLLAQTLESLIRKYCRSECSDRRDRIFAFMSLASDCASSKSLHADYRLSRLALLVKVLEFCQPTDPAEFISVLFKALTKFEGDSIWCRTVDVWEKARAEPPTFDHLPNKSMRSSETPLRLTQFVTATSLLHDWAKHSSFDAYQEDDDAGLDDEKSKASDGEHQKMIQ